MKFSEIDAKRWDELGPYLDTCLLPVTGLRGGENPWEATAALERLRDVMDKLEIPYKGRMVTYPAFHYIAGGNGTVEALESICRDLKETVGFRYIVLISADLGLGELAVPGADLIVTDGLIESGVYRSAVERMWSGTLPESKSAETPTVNRQG